MKKALILLIVLACFSCGENRNDVAPEINWDQKKSVDMNKKMAEDQEIKIKLFLAQHADWKVDKTGSGLYYFIYTSGNGEQAQIGMLAQVELKISLLDGTECYKTNTDEIDEFKIDRSDVETGVQEGIKKMKIGDRAKLIIPSHLAHGLVGDLNKIPPLTTIVVDIHLIDLKL
jgi:FKBP-type peptidyl-prolyl cis-trans isomerase